MEYVDLHDDIVLGGIRIEGTKKTHSDILTQHLAACFDATSLLDLSQRVEKAMAKIESLDIFKEIELEINPHPKYENELELLLRVKEKRYKLHTGTEIDHEGMSWQFSGLLSNIFGRAESLEFNSKFGAESNTPFSPGNGDTDYWWSVSVLNSISSYFSRRPFSDWSLGIQNALKVNGLYALHEWKHSINWRRIFNVPSGTSLLIRNEAGHYLNSIFSHTMSRGTRDCSFFPTRGYLVKSHTEWSALIGNLRYIKQDVLFQYHKTLFSDLVLSTTFKGGFLYSLNGKSCILDRYFIGGPLSVRNFSLDGIGPRNLGISLGGDIFCEIGHSVTFPFSKNSSKYVLGHVFVNSGSLIQYEKSKGIREHSMQLLNDFNISVGIGLIVKVFSAVRMEMNLGYPLRSTPGCRFHKGIQFGIGIDFL